MRRRMMLMTMMLFVLPSVGWSASPAANCHNLQSCLLITNHTIKPINLQAQPQYAAKSKNKGRTYYMPSKVGYSGTTFIFNPRSLMWGAYRDGKLIKKGKASGGKGYCKDVRRRCRTPVGSNFRVYSKGSPYCKSSKYPLGKGGAPMPYCMFFYKGYAIHGSPNVPNYNASHGCIRVLPKDAKWLHRNFIRHGTRVIVKPF